MDILKNIDSFKFMQITALIILLIIGRIIYKIILFFIQRKKCKFCLTKIHSKATICKHCGKEQP